MRETPNDRHCWGWYHSEGQARRELADLRNQGWLRAEVAQDVLGRWCVFYWTYEPDVKRETYFTTLKIDDQLKI